MEILSAEEARNIRDNHTKGVCEKIIKLCGSAIRNVAERGGSYTENRANRRRICMFR